MDIREEVMKLKRMFDYYSEEEVNSTDLKDYLEKSINKNYVSVKERSYT